MFTRTNTLAAVIAVLACSGAFAQQAPANSPPPSDAPSQAGVVYPGRPMIATTQTSSISGLTPANTVAPVAVNRLTGQASPGTPMGQLPPLPPQPGQSAVPQMPPMATPSQQYLNDMMPLDLPASLTEYKRRFEEASRASAQYVNTAAKPTSRSKTITQAPGEMSPTVRLASGMPTNVVFTDSTGAPWPIEFVTPGDTGVVDALVPVAGSATLQLRPKQPYMYGAVSVNLINNPIPVTLILATAQDEVDTRLDIRLARRGPNAQAPIIDRPGFTTIDSVMLQVLDGVAPGDAQVLKSGNADLRAWTYKGKLYVRTTLAVVSPAYSDTAASVDGTRVYVMPSVPSVTVSIDGVLRNVRIGE